MSFKNSAQFMARVMEKVLRGIDNAKCYIDDILVFTKDKEEHKLVLREICRRLSKHKLRVNPEKV